MTQFRFRAQKSIQSAGVLLNANGSGMEYIRLLKLLYIAEREQLAANGTPLIGGPLVAMRNGPLHDVVYAMLKDKSTHSAEWNKYFKTCGFQVSKIDGVDPGVTQLTRNEVSRLQDVSQRFASIDTWELVELTHQLPEWIAIYPGENTSRPIPPESVLQAMGISPEEAHAILESEKDAEQLNDELERLIDQVS